MRQQSRLRQIVSGVLVALAAVVTSSCCDRRPLGLSHDLAPPPGLPLVEQAEPAGCGIVEGLLSPHAPEVPQVLLVVDRSTSMVAPVDRWTPVTDAIAAVMAELSGRARFGLLMYPRQLPPALGFPGWDGCVEGVVNVEPALGQEEKIVDALRAGRPAEGSGTPTAAALRTAAQWLGDHPTGRDYVLLATDGGPGCNPGLDPNECICLLGSRCCDFFDSYNCLDESATLGAIRSLSDAGVGTLVLGIDPGVQAEGQSCEATPWCGANAACAVGGQECIDGACRDQFARLLDDMAVAGNTAVDGRHYEVSDLGELERQVRAAAGSLIPCLYDLGSADAKLDEIVVTIDDRPIDRDSSRSDGWEAGAGRLEFFGEACEVLHDGRVHDVRTHCAEAEAEPGAKGP